MYDVTATDSRIVRTKKMIHDAFIEVIQEMDVNKITVNLIAQRAGINRVTFYLHYKDLQDMLDRIVDGKIRALEAIFMERYHEPFQSGNELKTLIRLLEYISNESEIFKILLVSRKVPIFTQYFMELMSKLILQNNIYDSRITTTNPSPAKEIPRDIVAWHCASSMVGTIALWLGSDMPYSPHFLAQQIIKLNPFNLLLTNNLSSNCLSSIE